MKSAEEWSPLQLFYSGAFHKFLTATVNAQPAAVTDQEAAYVIGAFVLVGETSLARAYYEKQVASFNLEQTVMARFYLGLAENRLGNYGVSRELFATNLLELRLHKNLSHKVRFYIYQGMGVYYFYMCRYRLALGYAERARGTSLGASYIFGRILAADLVGHCRLKSGMLAQASAGFHEAVELSKVVGFGGLLDAVEINQLLIGCLTEERSLEDLKQSFDSHVKTNSFSGANLGLELTRQLALRSRLDEAVQVLKKVQTLLGPTTNRRQLCSAHLRGAYLHFLMGQTRYAADELQLSHDYLDFNADHSLALNYYGLRLRMGQLDPQQVEQHEQQLEHHRRLSQDGCDKRMALRNGGQVAARGDDRQADLIDRVYSEGPTQEVIEAVIHRGYLTLAHPLFDIPYGAKALVTDALPRRHLFFQRGQVTVVEAHLTPASKRLARQLYSGPKNLAELARALWGLKYDPVRHNSSLYSSISRLRGFLGPFRGWLVSDFGVVGFDEDLLIRFENLVQRSQNRGVGPLEPEAELAQLNLRQLEILRYTHREGSIRNRQVQQLFQVSYATATRDLTLLTELGLIRRRGQGRAVQYLAPEIKYLAP